jgi:hypothetical protein
MGMQKSCADFYLPGQHLAETSAVGWRALTCMSTGVPSFGHTRQLKLHQVAKPMGLQIMALAEF